jgi:hypothetical protein
VDLAAFHRKAKGVSTIGDDIQPWSLHLILSECHFMVKLCWLGLRRFLKGLCLDFLSEMNRCFGVLVSTFWKSVPNIVLIVISEFLFRRCLASVISTFRIYPLVTTISADSLFCSSSRRQSCSFREGTLIPFFLCIKVTSLYRAWVHEFMRSSFCWSFTLKHWEHCTLPSYIFCMVADFRLKVKKKKI